MRRRNLELKRGNTPPGCIAALLLVLLAAAGAEGASPPLIDEGLSTAWRLLRAVDCARCHGKDYEGLTAPSIVSYARTQTREMFVRMVLDGDPPRGMPGYRSNPRIAENIDDVYRYFVGRADGTIDSASRPRLP